MLSCKDCEHFKDGKCEYGIELYETDDAYDCTRFMYNGNGLID